MIHVQIRESYQKAVREEYLHEAATAVFAQLDIPLNNELSLVVTDDRQVQTLNLEHLGLDKPTDVLSYPSGEIDPDSGHTYLGDVIISFETALKQSQTAKHAIEEELQLLVVHGCLHLLGYDHAEDAEKEQMWAIQDEILKKLGLKIRPIN